MNGLAKQAAKLPVPDCNTVGPHSKVLNGAEAPTQPKSGSPVKGGLVHGQAVAGRFLELHPDAVLAQEITAFLLPVLELELLQSVMSGRFMYRQWTQPSHRVLFPI